MELGVLQDPLTKDQRACGCETSGCNNCRQRLARSVKSADRRAAHETHAESNNDKREARSPRTPQNAHCARSLAKLPPYATSMAPVLEKITSPKTLNATS
mmetsp:Transcript_48153/g.134082  ORF Transcript_48153/g.134082 Transcript_48153/m.134082 type:complete len:100 (+) Transcript_48153:454-753(+)